MPTPEFFDGFDHYATADILKKWTDQTNTGWSVSQSDARSPSGQGAHANNTNCQLRKTLSTVATRVVGGAFKFSSLPANGAIIGLVDGTSEQLSVRGDGAGHLTVTRNGTVLATSTNTVSTGVWYLIELLGTIHNTAGVYELRVNGTAWIANTTGANTRATSNNQSTGFQLGASGAGPSGLTADDVYAADGFLGPGRLVTSYPAAVGAESDWIGNFGTNFANVSEIIADGDSTFIESATAGDTDTYPMANVPAGTIAGVQITIQARQDAGAQRTIKRIVRQGGTDYAGSGIALAGSHTFYSEMLATQPDGSGAWSDTDFNAAEIGVKLDS